MVRPLVISGEQIKYLVSMREVVDAVEDSFRELALGHAKLYTKQKIYIDESHARFMAGSAFVGGSFDVYGTKLLGSSRDNPVKRGLPTRSGVVVLNDSHSGEVLAIIDGTVLTAVRTAACAAVAARYMARKDAETAGVFGVGAVGKELIRAFCAIRNIKTIKAIDTPSP
jgi:ornithine cyclodeaminase